MIYPEINSADWAALSPAGKLEALGRVAGVIEHTAIAFRDAFRTLELELQSLQPAPPSPPAASDTKLTP